MIIMGLTSAGVAVPLRVDEFGIVQIEGEVTELPHALLDGTINNDTVNAAPIEGDLIVGIEQGGGAIKWQRLARGSTGQFLRPQADGSLAWETYAPSVSAVDLLDGSRQQDTIASTVVEGDLIVGIEQGGGAIKWQRLARGSTGQFLRPQANGSLAWETYSPAGVPTGAIIEWGTSTAPTDYLLCNGAAVSRTTYAELFAVIGTTFGAGDGSTTFNVPDFRGRVGVGTGTGSGLTARTLAATGGVETHPLVTAELPAHTHTVQGRDTSAAGTTNKVVNSNSSGSVGDNPSGSTGSGTAHQNMQPFLVATKIIKT